MSKTYDGAFKLVRARQPKEGRGQGTCGNCGDQFTFVAEKKDGSLIYYWCPRCDIVRPK